MKLTIIQTGEVPAPLSERYASYPDMFQQMFADAGVGFDYEIVPLVSGAPLPDPSGTGGVLITGSRFGVYDDLPWMEPLRAFVRAAYAANTPLLGVCFGHQIMADALGGEVRKSEKGWGLGRHVYAVAGNRPGFLGGTRSELAVACSHQDQVITPPAEASVFLSSDFTPNAGLVYANGRAVSLQPHPEFSDDYALELVNLRRGIAPDEVIDTALASVSRPSDSREVAGYLGGFLTR